MKLFKIISVEVVLLTLACISTVQASVMSPNNLRLNQIGYQEVTQHQRYREIVAIRKELHTVQYLLETEKLKKEILLISAILLNLLTIYWYRKRWINYHKKIYLLEKQRDDAKTAAEEASKQNKNFIETIRQKSVLIGDLKKLMEVNRAAKTFNHKDLYDHLYNGSLLTPKQWTEFKIEFEKLHPLILLHAKEITPRITSAEERLICLMYLQLNNKQIGSILGISIDSVARSKRRLKLRIPIPAGDSLEDFIFKLNTFTPHGTR